MGGFSFDCSQTPRPCALFTLLRNPLARLLSGYHYFCQDCQEDGRQCPGYVGYKGVDREGRDTPNNLSQAATLVSGMAKPCPSHALPFYANENRVETQCCLACSL